VHDKGVDSSESSDPDMLNAEALILTDILHPFQIVPLRLTTQGTSPGFDPLRDRGLCRTLGLTLTSHGYPLGLGYRSPRWSIELPYFLDHALVVYTRR
jgi:hypothetical protein